MNRYRLFLRRILPALVLFGCSTAASTAEIERGLPPNTMAVLTVNFKQLLHAPAVKPHVLGPLQQAFRSTDSLREALTSFGFDPIRDLDRLTIARASESWEDAGVVIVRGRFDTARFHLAASKLVKQYSDRLSVHTANDLKYYAVASSDKHGSLVFGAGGSSKKGMALTVNTKGNLLDAVGGFCVTLADKNTLIAASSEELLKGACHRIADKRAESGTKAMRRLLADLDGKQTIVFAFQRTHAGIETSEASDSEAEREKIDKLQPLPPLPPSIFGKSGIVPEADKPVPPPPPATTPASEEARQEPGNSSLREMSGSIAVADDFKLRCTLRTSSIRDARGVMKDFEDLRLRMGGLMMMLAGSNKNYAFLKEIPNSFLAVRKGNLILIEGHLSAETLAKLAGTEIDVKAR